MACSNIRYGAGVTAEVGMDLANMKAKNVAVFTDKTVANLPAMKTTVDSLTKNKVNFKVYDDVRVEPTDVSFKAAADFAKKGDFYRLIYPKIINITFFLLNLENSPTGYQFKSFLGVRTD